MQLPYFRRVSEFPQRSPSPLLPMHREEWTTMPVYYGHRAWIHDPEKAAYPESRGCQRHRWRIHSCNELCRSCNDETDGVEYFSIISNPVGGELRQLYRFVERRKRFSFTLTNVDNAIDRRRYDIAQGLKVASHALRLMEVVEIWRSWCPCKHYAPLYYRYIWMIVDEASDKGSRICVMVW